jgi:3-hydroxyisobutyrate dehydrogenase
MDKPTIGWIGTGVMGRSMAAHLIREGYPLRVFNRTTSKANSLIDQGATWCDCPKEVAAQSQIIFTIVGYPEDVHQVVLGKDGILSRTKPETILVDMTTSTPRLAKKIYQACQSKSISALDAPVSGGDIGAREGKLAIMVGGDKASFQKVLPLFQMMGENIAYMGEAGAGQHTKMSNQILIASTMVGVVESLIYAYKSGLNMEEVIEVIGRGAAASWSINNLGRRIQQKNFDPGFYIKHFVKDMGIALQEAARMKLSLPGLSLANQFYLAAMAMGYENLGTQGLYKVFESMNHLV